MSGKQGFVLNQFGITAVGDRNPADLGLPPITSGDWGAIVAFDDVRPKILFKIIVNWAIAGNTNQYPRFPPSNFIAGRVIIVGAKVTPDANIRLDVPSQLTQQVSQTVGKQIGDGQIRGDFTILQCSYEIDFGLHGQMYSDAQLSIVASHGLLDGFTQAGGTSAGAGVINLQPDLTVIGEFASNQSTDDITGGTFYLNGPPSSRR